MIPLSAIPAATTTPKHKYSALHGSSKRTKKNTEPTSQPLSTGFVSKQTTLDDFMGRSSTTEAQAVSVPLVTESILVSTPYSQCLQALLSLAIVDASLSKVTKKVESLSTTISSNTLAVNTAGEELKKLPSSISSKSEVSQLSALQKEATFVLPEIEEQLKALDVDAHKTTVATDVAPADTSLVDDDKEGEKNNEDAAVDDAQGEEEDEDDEEIGLEDQGSKDDVADNDDNEDDPSLWFTPASISVPAPTLKEVFIQEAGDRKEIKSIRVERLYVEFQKDASLALKVQSTLVKDKKLKKNPVKVQEALLKEIKEENRKAKENLSSDTLKERKEESTLSYDGDLQK
ncbi:hypothetical protein L6452_25680 [Arctium lappa]|uniref:Uncharacterized protein n=1 Tax=Arctium lappa TaxID=4217 RepID=A0ACB9AFT6_ARCLA|nr:hypothetical protein L6452_25680 [Arctium lappa]